MPLKREVHNDSISMMARVRQDALAAWDTVRKLALMWGISKEAFVDDWLGHVYGEKTGLEHEPAFGRDARG